MIPEVIPVNKIPFWQPNKTQEFEGWILYPDVWKYNSSIESGKFVDFVPTQQFKTGSIRSPWIESHVKTSVRFWYMGSGVTITLETVNKEGNVNKRQELQEASKMTLFESSESYLPVNEDFMVVLKVTEKINNSWLTVGNFSGPDPCKTKPCQNNGVCSASLEEIHCDCQTNGTSGKFCENIDGCDFRSEAEGNRTGNEVCNKAQCSSETTDGSFKCTCSSDQFFNYLTQKCEERDPCAKVTCGNNAHCEEGSCKCEEHFKMNNDNISCDAIDYCKDECGSANCTEGPSGFPDRVVCGCDKQGFVFNAAEKACQNEICKLPSLHQCQYKCKVDNSANGYSCICPEGIKLNQDGKTCNFPPPDCQCENGICNVIDGKDVCKCIDGTIEKGGKCLDLCTAEQAPCPGSCSSLGGGKYKCNCEGKWELSNDGITCQERDMCMNNAPGFQDCASRNANCVANRSSDLGYKCECERGKMFFNYTNGKCVDPCKTVEGIELRCETYDAICHSIDSKPRCTCKPGFKRFEEGKKCQISPVAYSFNLSFVDPNQNPSYLRFYRPISRKLLAYEGSEITGEELNQIKDKINETMFIIYGNILESTSVINCLRSIEDSVVCETTLGAKKTTFNVTTRLVDECQDTEKEKCQIGKLTLYKDKVDKVVVVDLDYCDAKYGLCDAEVYNCVPKPESMAKFECKCKDGLRPQVEINEQSKSCKDINECEEGIHSCDNETQNCKNTVGSYSCECKEGYVKLSSNPKECVVADVCNLKPNDCDPVTTRCKTSGPEKYFCECKDGFKDDKDLDTSCKDINECEEGPFDCDNKTTTCENIIGSYKCTCKTNYKLKENSSTSCQGMCEDTPCGSHGECISKNDAFECRCEKDYTGTRCEVYNEALKESQKTTSIVAAVLGIALFNVLLIGLIIFYRARQRRYNHIEAINHRNFE